ncbi:rCG38735 [Rattus norvegicus]|uniref:RCG38735 n=1 Tax=Rattus norvegicus TaxID=10116 RepID=A6K9K7_RAT|nr:rCG38735 [Rattus norvegicus]
MNTHPPVSPVYTTPECTLR